MAIMNKIDYFKKIHFVIKSTIIIKNLHSKAVII